MEILNLSYTTNCNSCTDIIIYDTLDVTRKLVDSLDLTKYDKILVLSEVTVLNSLRLYLDTLMEDFKIKMFTVKESDFYKNEYESQIVLDFMLENSYTRNCLHASTPIRLYISHILFENDLLKLI